MILPMLMYLSFFVLDLGRVMLIHSALNDSAYIAARAGAQRGGAGTSTLGASKTAFDNAVSGLPAVPVENASLVVNNGTCTNEDSYIDVTAKADVDFMMPGLQTLVGLASNGTWQLQSRAIVLCEIVP